MGKKPSKKKESKLPEFIDSIELKHSFTDAEKASILNDMGKKIEEKEQLITQSKTSAKQWKNKIEEIQNSINSLAMKGRDGYELRKTDVKVVMDRKRGKKKIFDKKTGDLIREDEMTQHDFERLPLEFPAPKVAEPPKSDEGLTKVSEAMDAAEDKNKKGSEETDSHSE